jgi:hypothetical protein
VLSIFPIGLKPEKKGKLGQKGNDADGNSGKRKPKFQPIKVLGQCRIQRCVSSLLKSL